METGVVCTMQTGSGVLRAVVVVAVGAVLVLVFLWGYQRRLIYLPDTAAAPMARLVIEGARDVRLRTDDGLELGAWFVPAGERDRNLAVLVANGNAGNRASRIPLATALRDIGLAVLLFDYRGYGGNSG